MRLQVLCRTLQQRSQRRKIVTGPLCEHLTDQLVTGRTQPSQKLPAALAQPQLARPTVANVQPLHDQTVEHETLHRPRSGRHVYAEQPRQLGQTQRFALRHDA